MRLKERWSRYTAEQVQRFLREGPEGIEHPSRVKTVALLDGMTSVLDVGCGTGVLFELLRARRPDIDYAGIDVTEQFVAEARRRYPAEAARFEHRSLFDRAGAERTFDAVVARHVLEHLPDYAPAVQRMWAHARRKLFVTFYLPPRPLRLRRKRDERFSKGFYTHTYDLGRFVAHLLDDLDPLAAEVRIHPRQGTSDPRLRWGDRENVVYEIIRP